MWYSNLYRRHLVDMHINDYDERFLSEFSPETYVAYLKKAKINYAMLYFQSHVGLCYYPTKTGVMHKAFVGREDAMKRLVDLCHKNGIRVIGYYSLIYNTVEHDRHPEWKLIKANGKSGRDKYEQASGEEQLAFASLKGGRYGHCCPNNEAYTRFVFAQIDEMLEYFGPDAMFFDMPFWPGTCYCEHCKKRYMAEVGTDIPVSPAPGSEAYLQLIDKKYEWMGQWIARVTAHVKSKAPDMPVEHNYASGIAGDSSNGCGQEVNLACDYSGGDLYGDIKKHSFSCKFFKNSTRNQPFEYMFSRCKPALRSHTLTKTLDQMKTSVALVMAHHGATLMIDAIDPVGTMDERVYERFGKVFDFQIPYEPYFRGDMVEDVGIYYGIRSKFDPTDEKRTAVTCGVGASNMLMRKHIPFGVTGYFHELGKYKAIIAPVLSEGEKRDHERILDYVREGGTLYLSGARNKALTEELTGARFAGMTEQNHLYMAPKDEYVSQFCGFNAKYPLPYDGIAPILEGADPATVIATLTFPYTGRYEMQFASIHSDPPGVPTDIPAIIVRKYGKGTVVWSALSLESGETEESGDILWSVLSAAGGLTAPSFKTTAPANVELTLFEDGDEKFLNAVVLCDDAATYPVAPFIVKVKVSTEPKAVELLPEGKPVPFTYRDGYVSFKARKLHIFDMYRIRL
ncbi:MAG: alpha-L-fucosidase [Clostridia bacterium]|nr:alpha-L-fucosidase [Clostridia bacterium]